MDTLDPDMYLILAIRRLAYQFDDSKHYVKYRVLMRAADRLKFLRAEHNRVNRLAACGTVQNWLALSDEDKAKWFAVLIAGADMLRLHEKDTGGPPEL